MRRVRKYRKYRRIKELYVCAPEITAVSKGDCAGPENEVDRSLKMELSITESQCDKHFLSGKSPKTREESKTCNVCSTSVSSCMHIKRVASLVATKTDGFSDEVTKVKAANWGVINNADLSSPSASSACNGRHCTSSETSNLFSADLNHNPFSGNTKLKDTSKASPNSEDFETLAKESSELSVEKVESSLKSMATFRVGDQIRGMHSYAELLKAPLVLNDRGPSIELKKYSDKKEYDEKCDAVVEEQEAPLQSQPVNYEDGLDIMEDEVKVCDICGDTGREELLATCSRCSDGAEHIYCMRVKMDKVPGDDWMCEECMFNEESEKQNKNKHVKPTRVVKGSSLSEIRQNSKTLGAVELKNRLEPNIKCSRVEIKTKKVGSTPSFAVKESTCNIEAKSFTKKRAPGTSLKSPRVSNLCRKTVLHRDSSNKELDKKEMKSTNDVISGDRSSYSSLKNAYLKISSEKSNKLQSQTQMTKGALLKSKSFNVIHSKVKGKLSDEGGTQKHKFVDSNATGDNKKKNIGRKMCKSLSFGNTRSDHSNGSDTKVKMPPPCHLKDFKKSAHAIEENSTQLKYTAKLPNPLVSSPVNRSGVLMSKSDRKVAPSGQASGHDLETGQRKTKILSEATNHLAHGGSMYLNEWQNKAVGDVKRAAVANRENNSNFTSHLEGRSHMRNSPNTVSPVFAVPQLDYTWKGGFEMWTNGRLVGSCDGIQAHLSSVASPKVLEVVPKLSQKILVEEIPRLSTWPTQFVGNRATEDNIALYFFAEDLESYGRNYKILLECMVRDDLALRANFDGVELLIFPSNLLPDHAQCWNRMLFLWGVFRGRRIRCSEILPLPGDVNQVGFILKGGESKKRLDMDFRSHLQGNKRYMDSVKVAEEPDCKRVKRCLSGMQENKVSKCSKYPDKGFSFQIDGLGPAFSGERTSGGAYDISVPLVDKQVIATKGEDQTESKVPGLELSLGVPFFGFEHKNDDRTSDSKLVPEEKKNVDNELSTSLSLSLALPSPLGN